jgi:hypothetical protein
VVRKCSNQPTDYKSPSTGGSWFVPMGLEPENQPCAWFGFQPELVRTTCSGRGWADQGSAA